MEIVAILMAAHDLDMFDGNNVFIASEFVEGEL